MQRQARKATLHEAEAKDAEAKQEQQRQQNKQPFEQAAPFAAARQQNKKLFEQAKLEAPFAAIKSCR